MKRQGFKLKFCLKSKMPRQLKRRFKRELVKETVGFENLCSGGAGGEVKKQNCVYLVETFLELQYR